MKSKIIVTLAALLIGFFYGTGHAGSFPLQGNLEAMNYWNPAIPFKDLIFQTLTAGLKKTADNTDCAVAPLYNKNGYPTNVPQDCYFLIIPALHVSNSPNWKIPPTLTGVKPFKGGRYLFTYSGVADFEFQDSGVVVVSKAQGRYELDVTNPGVQGIAIKVKNYGIPYAKDFHLVHVDDVSTYQTQPFNENFLAALSPYEILRFMDWGRTNESILVYGNEALPNTNLTPNSLTLGGDAPTAPNAYHNKMVVMVKVNGKFPRVMLSGYDPATKTIKFATPLPASTDGLPIAVYIHDFYNKTWASRTRKSPILQTSHSGVAFDYMIKLANITKKAPWFCIPTAANDDFVLKLLSLIDRKLNKNLKVYIEYSNETWAFNFPQYGFSEAMEKKLGLNAISHTLVPADAYHSYRATQIFRLASQFNREPALSKNRASSRFIRVLNSQAVWIDRAKSVMDWGLGRPSAPTFGHAAYEYADVFALAPYFGRPRDDTTNLTTAPLEQLYAIQKTAIDEMYGTSTAPGYIRQQLANTSQRGIKLAQYEGGTNLTDTTTDSFVTLTNLVNFNRSDYMYELYKYNLSQWKALQTEFGADAVGNFSQFAVTGSSNKYGHWWAVESVYQPLLSSPKYRAFSEFAASP